MKWTCKTGKNKGRQCEASAFDKHVEQLTLIFQDAGAQYSYSKDFNKSGEFHGAVKSQWDAIRKVDPKFGTGRNKARTDKELFTKFVTAVREGEIRPYENPEDLLLCIIFILGFYCGLRGSTEHVELMTEHVYVGEFTAADGEELCGLRYGGVKVPFSKTAQLKLKNARLPADQDVMLPFSEDPQHDCWCPFQIFCFYISKCHPNAKKFYARVVKPGCEEAKNLKKAFNREICFAESGPGRSNWNLGPTKHRELCKLIAKKSGVDKWESCTGHALRALCISWCICQGLAAADVAAKVRHSCIKSQLRMPWSATNVRQIA